MTYYTDNGRELTELEYKIWLEGMAYGIWQSRRLFGKDDGSCKMCDPLLFKEKVKEVYSYVFDLWDGGRHHKYKTLDQVKDALLNEILK